jgi:acyl carrier protein
VKLQGTPMDIEAQVRKYILQNFMYTDDESRLTREASLIDSGIVDSTGALELVSFIEEAFNVHITDDELVPDNFDSLAKLTTFIQRKLASA